MSKQSTKKADAAIEALRALAMSFPGVDEVPVCVNAAFKAGKKSFLFLGMKDDSYHVRLKLGDSLSEAQALAAKDPDRYEAAAIGWVKATYGRTEVPPKGLLERWIEESFRMLAPKKLLREWEARG